MYLSHSPFLQTEERIRKACRHPERLHKGETRRSSTRLKDSGISRPQAVREGSEPLDGCRAAWIAPSGTICTANEVDEISDVESAA